MISTYAHDMEVDVEEEKDGRIKVIFTESENIIVVWLDPFRAGRLKDYLSATLESIERRKDVPMGVK